MNLQQVVDMLHQEEHLTVTNEHDKSQKKNIEISKRISVNNIEDLKRVTLDLANVNRTNVSLNANDRVELPVFDKKSQRNMLVILEPTEFLNMNGQMLKFFVKNKDGQWKIHDDVVHTWKQHNETGTIGMINLSVVRSSVIR